VSHVDPKTNKEFATIETGLEMFGVAVGDGSVWAAGSPEDCSSGNEGALVRIDSATNKVVGRTDIKCAYSVAATDDAVWVHHDTGGGMGFVTRVEPAR
jgi:hypothetical protein